MEDHHFLQGFSVFGKLEGGVISVKDDLVIMPEDIIVKVRGLIHLIISNLCQ